jgi:sugar fermentation stimulation protein A
MKYENIRNAVFRGRPNRFIAMCELDGADVTAHVPNTGRCRELLVPGYTVYLTENQNPARKTRWTLVSVNRAGRLINMDALAPNRAFREAVEDETVRLPGLDVPTFVKPECRFGDSRFDFYLEDGVRRAFAEVKGVTLEEDGAALFPDAPTERGVRHVRELCRAAKEGCLAYLILVVQMEGVDHFSPNRRTHPAFADALLAARESGVRILAYDCRVAPDEIRMNRPVPVVL